MNLELTESQQTTLHMAVLTRMRAVERLIQGWEEYPGEHTESLIETYSKELAELKDLEMKII